MQGHACEFTLAITRSSLQRSFLQRFSLHFQVYPYKHKVILAKVTVRGQICKVTRARPMLGHPCKCKVTLAKVTRARSFLQGPPRKVTLASARPSLQRSPVQGHSCKVTLAKVTRARSFLQGRPCTVTLASARSPLLRSRRDTLAKITCARAPFLGHPCNG